MARRWVRRGLALAFTVLVVLPFLLVLLHRTVPVVATPLMFERLLEGQGWHQSWRPLEDISPHLIAAVIASEDAHFCRHDGVDWGAIHEAQSEVERGDREQPRGASTIPQQTTKNLLLWPAQTRLRKGLELTYVTWVSAFWPKRRILEVYLNIVEMGPGLYGAEAAAQAYFGIAAAELSRSQAALLAVSLPNPLARDPAAPSQRLQSRARRIEARMRQLGPLLDCVSPQRAAED